MNWSEVQVFPFASIHLNGTANWVRVGNRLVYSNAPIDGAWKEPADVPLGWDERDAKL